MPYEPNALLSFLEFLTPWLGTFVPAIIAYFGGNLIGRIANPVMRFMCLITFIIAPVILWYIAAYADGCLPGVGQPGCMWVGFGMLVFTVPYILYCIIAVVGYMIRRRRQKGEI